MAVHLYCISLYFFISRHGESWGTGAGRARLPHALPPGLPRVTPRDDETVLEEGARWKADLRVYPVLFRRLLHSYRATVPARRQPLVVGDLGRTLAYRGTSVEIQYLGIQKSFNKAANALLKLQNFFFLNKLFHTETGVRDDGFGSRGLSLVCPGTKYVGKWLSVQMSAGRLSSENSNHNNP